MSTDDIAEKTGRYITICQERNLPGAAVDALNMMADLNSLSDDQRTDILDRLKYDLERKDQEAELKFRHQDYFATLEAEKALGYTFVEADNPKKPLEEASAELKQKRNMEYKRNGGPEKGLWGSEKRVFIAPTGTVNRFSRERISEVLSEIVPSPSSLPASIVFHVLTREISPDLK